MLQPRTTTSPYSDDVQATKALLRTLLFDPNEERISRCPIFDLPWFGGEAEEVYLDAMTGDFSIREEGTQMIRELSNNWGWRKIFQRGGFFAFDHLRGCLGPFRVGNRPFKDYFQREMKAPPENVILTFLNSVQVNISSRRLATTATGHVGIVPNTARYGDRIYVLIGCSMPVILRPDVTGKFYEYVGECYIDGFMKGEGTEALDAGKYQLQNITLC